MNGDTHRKNSLDGNGKLFKDGSDKIDTKNLDQLASKLR